VVKGTDMHIISGFSSRWYPDESLVAAGRASGQDCSHVPVKVPPILVDTSELLNKGVTYIKFGCKFGSY